MTLTEFLKLPKDKQELEVAKCFTPKPWPHRTGHYGEWLCVKCRKTFHRESDCMMSFCDIPSPLTLDWNLAKKLQAKCDRDKFQYGLWLAGNVYPPRDRQREKILDYATYEATPIHYIVACMEAKNYFDKEQHNEN